MVTVVFWGFAAIWTTLLLVPDPGRFLFLSVEVPDPLAHSPVPADKVAHASGYFLFMLLAAAAFNSRLVGVRFVWLVAAGAAHGALTELAQLAVPARDGSWDDFVVDVVGLGIGAMVWLLIRRVRDRRSAAQPSPQQQAAGKDDDADVL
jgi:VanZ family protein